MAMTKPPYGAMTKPQHETRNYPNQYSVVEIVFVDGTKTEFVINAGCGYRSLLA